MHIVLLFGCAAAVLILPVVQKQEQARERDEIQAALQRCQDDHLQTLVNAIEVGRRLIDCRATCTQR